MFGFFKECLRTFKISYILAKEYGIDLAIGNPMFKPTVKLIATMIETSELTNEQIANLVAYNFNLKSDPTEK